MHDSLTHLEQVARLTHVKDRDTTDSVLVEVLRALLQQAVVTLIEVMPWNDEWRCLVRSHIAPGMVAPASTSPWASPDELDLLNDFPHRLATVESRQTGVYEYAGRPCLVVPVLSDGERALLIEVLLGAEPEPSTIRMVEGIARIYQNFLSLLDYSERDSLTSLLNRKSFDETFFKATSSSGRTPPDGLACGQRRAHDSSAYWLGVIDIDHFKLVNDRHGHLIGDEVLLLIARVMRSTFRHDDRLYRFGGEEFVVLLRADDENAAHAIFERFRHNVEQYPFPQVGRITASVGFTRVRDHDTPAAAFERADKGVYLAKAQGRNLVRGYERHVGASAELEHRPEGDVELF
ncbi:GGDEF domain-containing protein [Hydrogenophaga aquatica]